MSEVVGQKILVSSCPFCGGMPIAEPWHGGASTKIMIHCANDCEVAPGIAGETPEEAQAAWNARPSTISSSHIVIEDPFATI